MALFVDVLIEGTRTVLYVALDGTPIQTIRKEPEPSIGDDRAYSKGLVLWESKWRVLSCLRR